MAKLVFDFDMSVFPEGGQAGRVDLRSSIHWSRYLMRAIIATMRATGTKIQKGPMLDMPQPLIIPSDSIIANFPFCNRPLIPRGEFRR